MVVAVLGTTSSLRFGTAGWYCVMKGKIRVFFFFFFFLAFWVFLFFLVCFVGVGGLVSFLEIFLLRVCC